MDDTTQSRTSDVAASAATRKRRSSILKSQRPPRTPFCELEFNVCTPTDTTKSRRVSFSKRTGVAEFATNEATTTWKNFYEEHNKSLESSGNESALNHGKQPVAHLGKRIFDQQFEEVEAVDFMGTLNPGINITASMNNINFTQIECTETKLTAPQSNFEVSALTETQSKLFGHNLGITCSGETLAPIDVNFSAIQPIDEKDYLDEIEKDLHRHSNIVCPGPFTGQDISEYIEVDLNMTHAAIANDESNMSITDTISSPKVQDVSKNCLIDKKISISKDWAADKENIVLNPYVAPRESFNFATEMPDEVLVFDGKRLIVETENSNKENYRQSVVPKPFERVPQRKTIVLNCNDGLPNFLEEAQASRSQSLLMGLPEMQQSCILEDKPAYHNLDETQNMLRTIIYGDELDDISVTQAVPNVISDVEKRRTIVYHDKAENVPITRDFSSNIMDEEKRRTIMFENDDDNISITQAVPANVMIPHENEKRKTIVFQNESCNISMTQAIPINIIQESAAVKQGTIVFEDNVSMLQSIPTQKASKESRRTVVHEDNTGNISVTHSKASCSSKEFIRAPDKRTTIVFDSDIGNISVTQALPSNIILPEKLNVTTHGKDANISMTQSLPTNILLGNNIEPNKRRTVLFKDDTGNLSITQAVTKNQVIQGISSQQLSDTEVVSNCRLDLNNINGRSVFGSKDILRTQASIINKISEQEILSKPLDNITGTKRQTIVFQNYAADISITQAIPVSQVIDNVNVQNQLNVENIESCFEALRKESSTNKRRTVVFENDDADISFTQAVPMNQVIETVNEQKQKDDYGNFEIRAPQERQQSINKKSVYQIIDTVQNYNVETTRVVPDTEGSTNKRRTIVFDNDDADISITQGIPTSKVIDAMLTGNQNLEATNAVLHQELNNKRRTVVFENDDADISMTQTVPMNKVIDTAQKENCIFEDTNAALHIDEITCKRTTEVFENHNADISTTQAVASNLVINTIQNENQNIDATTALPKELINKRRTVVFENDEADISMTLAVPINQVIDAIQNKNYKTDAVNVALPKDLTNKRNTVVFENDEADISMTLAVPINQVIDTIQNENYNIDKTYAALPKTLANKSRTVDYENEDTNISMNIAVPINQVIDKIQNKNHNIEATNVALQKYSTNKRNTVVFENDEADISMTLAVPINEVIDAIQKQNENIETTNMALDQEKSNKRRTVDFKNNAADTSATQEVTLNQVFQRQNDVTKHNITQNENVIIKNETFYYNNAMYNKTPHVVYDDDEGDIAMTRAVSSSIILPNGEEKKRTIVIESVESLLENKDLFMEIDRLTDDTSETKTSVKVSADEDYDISMSDFSDMEIGREKSSAHDGNDIYGTKLNRENVSSNKQDISRTEIEEQTATLSKPIPAGLAAFQQRTFDKSQCQDLIKLDSTLAMALDDVLVYQSGAANIQNVLKTDKEVPQIKSQEKKVAFEEKKVVFEENKVAFEEIKDSSLSLSKINSEVTTSEQEQLDTPNDSNSVDLIEKTTSNNSVVKAVDFKQNSILNDLLDMSQSSIEGTDDKGITAQISVHEEQSNVNQADPKNSTDAMFYITRDSDDDPPIDISETTSKEQLCNQDLGQIEAQSPLSIEYKDDDDPPIIRDLQAKLSTIKSAMKEDPIPQVKSIEHNKLDDTSSKVSLDMSKKKNSKSFKMANDTNELLEMLSDFTDKRMSRNVPLEELKEDDDTSESRLSFEDKVELLPEPPRFNRTLKRQSMALSREDLLNNLSMASAVLQKPASDFDDSDRVEDTPNLSNTHKEHKKSVRMSADIVKTLHFDDDSISEEAEPIPTPLKKTTFGEISYMKDVKSKVIPGFITNVSDGIKELMDDLVKPMTEVQPFTMMTPERSIKKNASTCSTQIQANLLNTSQIDLHTELYSTTNSVSEMNKISSSDIISDAVNRSMLRAFQTPEKSTPMYSQSTKSSDMDVTSDDTDDKSDTTTVQTKPVSNSRPIGSVLIFDQHNPLNNVLLVPTPLHAIDIHTYDPIRPNEKIPLPSDNTEMEKQEEKITDQYRMELSSPDSSTKQENIDKADTQTIISNTSKSLSVDQYTEPESNNVRDMETNTVIAMKGNEELLGVSSSLTLVDRGLNRSNSCSPTNTSRRDSANSPVKVLYRVDEMPLTKVDSDFTSTDEIQKPSKAKKRVYSPTKREKHKQCTLSTLDVTPKPIAKKRCSPDYEPTKLPAERDESPEPEKRGKSRGKSKKAGTTITVQQLMTMIHVEPNREEEGESEVTGSVTTEVLGLASSSEVVSSFASSNNLRDVTSARSSLSGNPSRLEWVPATTSHSIIDNVYSSDDIVELIDAMPFMGSYYCQWECAAGSVWSLLLLHSWLRLTVRFAAPPRLRPDTPVLNIELETLHQDKKNPITHLCVVFAAEMMRHYMSRGCGAAGDVRRLLRQLCGTARLAAQWARAMHDARARLAYSLSHDGWLALKVANMSYRTVWEVSMRLELEVQHARAAPFPRACGVRVARVLAGGPAPPDVARAVAAAPRDWGHAPRTIWKVFRYLKHKKRDDDGILNL